MAVPNRALGRRLPFLRAFVLACALAAATLALTGARAAAQDLTVHRVSGWRAPGVRVTVGGWGPAAGTVVLRERDHVVATTTAGPQGRFQVGFASLRPGLYPLTVTSDGETLSAGTVRIRPVTLDAVGDITFGEQVGPTLDRLGGRYPWTSVAPSLRRADVATGNLETTVSLRGTPAGSKQYTFRGAPWMLRPVHSYAGLDVLTLANNHAVDYGRSALLDTIHAVRAAGMETIGAGASSSLARRPAIVTRGGLRIALLGYSDINPPGFTATADAPGTAPADPAQIGADVRAALRRADVAVCFFHWGVELHPLPDDAPEGARGRLPSRRRVARARSASPRVRADRPAEPAHARRLDARQLRLPLGRHDRAHRHPPGSPRDRRRRGLPEDAGDDPGIPAGPLR